MDTHVPASEHHADVTHRPCRSPTLSASEPRCRRAGVFANARYRHDLGLTPASLYGRLWCNLFDDASKRRLCPLLERAFATTKTLVFDGEIGYRQAGTHTVNIRFIPGHDHPHTSLYVLTTDTPSAERLAHALRTSEQRFNDFTDIAVDWFWEMDAQLRFTRPDPRFSPAVGIPPNDIIGHTRQDIYAEQIAADPERWQPHLRDLGAHRPFRDFEFLTRAATVR